MGAKLWALNTFRPINALQTFQEYGGFFRTGDKNSDCAAFFSQCSSHCVLVRFLCGPKQPKADTPVGTQLAHMDPLGVLDCNVTPCKRKVSALVVEECAKTKRWRLRFGDSVDCGTPGNQSTSFFFPHDHAYRYHITQTSCSRSLVAQLQKLTRRGPFPQN